MTKLEAALKQFKSASQGFEEVLRIPKTDIVRDSAIQRFEFTLDLSWKTLKAFLEEKKGISCASPLGCFKEAYRQGIIDYEDVWVEMVKTRNKTVHTYNEQLAEEVYKDLPEALRALKKLLASIEYFIDNEADN